MRKANLKYGTNLVNAILVFALVVSLNGFVFASEDARQQALFQQANGLYGEGEFEKASAAYEKLIETGGPTSECYYNLGNAYFKSGKTGQAILNFERARRILPRDPDILTNLNYAKRTIEYEIKDSRNWYARKMSDGLQYVTGGECWLLAMIGYFLLILSLLIRLLRRKATVISLFNIFIFVIFLLLSAPLMMKYSSLGTENHAIVITPEVEVHYGPSQSDRIAFRLVEGLDVSVTDSKEDWCRVRLNDGQSGWLVKANVEAI